MTAKRTKRPAKRAQQPAKPAKLAAKPGKLAAKPAKRRERHACCGCICARCASGHNTGPEHAVFCLDDAEARMSARRAPLLSRADLDEFFGGSASPASSRHERR